MYLPTPHPRGEKPFGQGSLHASPRRGPALAPHAVRVAAARHRGAGTTVPPRGHRGRRRSGHQSRYEVQRNDKNIRVSKRESFFCRLGFQLYNIAIFTPG